MLCRVIASVSSMRRRTRLGTRPPRRPMKRTRTPFSFSSSRRAISRRSLKFMRNRTSSSGRRQFSVENANTVIHDRPMSRPPSTVSKSASSPAACPSVRFSPRCCAHRPLPSMTNATCAGIRSGSRCTTGRTVAPAAQPLREPAGISTEPSCSPTRPCNRASQAGAHQFHLPMSFIVAGTRKMRTIGRVDDDGEREAEAELLHGDDLAGREAGEHDHDQQRGRRDDLAGALEPERDRAGRCRPRSS